MGNSLRILDIFKSAAILIIPRAFYRGIILYFCWLWYAVPFGLPSINYWSATIIGGVISTLTFEHIGETHSASVAFVKMMEWFFAINVFFAMAIIIHLFGVV